jgi:hypothetical protein
MTSCSSIPNTTTFTRLSRALLCQLLATRPLLIVSLQGHVYDARIKTGDSMSSRSLQAACRQHKVRCERAVENGPCVRCRRVGAMCVSEAIKVAESEINQCVHFDDLERMLVYPLVSIDAYELLNMV